MIYKPCRSYDLEMTIVKTLKIRFLSDWHIGEGSGQPGHIDKLVRRHPQDGLPYVPAKTITGIWRDACEQLAVGLDNEQANGGWQTWVTTLFGDQPNERAKSQPEIAPQSARLSIRSGRFPKALRQQLEHCLPLKEALTWVKPSARIDRQTGQTIDKHLHFDEVVRTGALLEAQVALDKGLSESEQQTAQALLWAGAKAVERLGGKRRRGLGRCEFQFDTMTQEDALNILKQQPIAPEPQSHDKVRQFVVGNNALQTDTWVQVPLYLTLKSPVIVLKGELGNVMSSLDYIPGTHLLGPVTKRLKQHIKLNLFNEVAKGDMQISPAYLDVFNTRGLPVPMALFHEKENKGLNNKDNQGGPVWNRLEEGLGESDKIAQLKQHREGYISPFNETDNTLPRLFEMDLQVTTHGTIEDQEQRPSEKVGGVFSFEAIQAGTRLQAILKVRQSLANQLQAVNEKWWETLNSDIRIGSSKKDDYGWVQLSVGPCQLLPSQPLQHDNQKLVVWLCSDLLLRDARLRPSTDLNDLQKELETQLNVTLSLRKNQALSALIRTNRTDGWHQEWGQPRPSYIGLAAGSCLVFECQAGSLDENQLQALMQRGLGERRAEGFGEVRFNPPLLMQALSNLPPAIWETASSEEGISHFAQDNDAFVSILETAAWRKDIQHAALALSENTAIRHKTFAWQNNRPPNSQLGALRATLTRMQNATDKQQVIEWLAHLRKTENRRDKWTVQALNLISDVIQKPQLIWETLQKAGEQNGLKQMFPTLRANGKVNLEETLWAEAVRTLFVVAIHYERES